MRRAVLLPPRVDDIKYSYQLAMPTDADIRISYIADAFLPLPPMLWITDTRPCIFSSVGRKHGTKINSIGAVLLGHTRAGMKIWASFVLTDLEEFGSYVNAPQRADLEELGCYVDEPLRALVDLRFINDSDADPAVRDGQLVLSMANVETWDEGIKGSNLEERYAYVYDVLLDEARRGLNT
ncbi:hypothetical protein HBI81_256490 [Parastagonospora nodorum]|nr:hypothetical protein HBI18_241230 [Parastagonospora nodorum]KAH6510778.1 hypothetical protein HBI81_256490 [Parastagonospora nodorum]